MRNSFVLFVVALITIARTSQAAPYETVAIYSKTGASPSKRELVIEDVMVGDYDNVVIPSAFRADDGATYQLVAIEERLDVIDVDKQYLAPFWNFSVSAHVDGVELSKPALLSKERSDTSWVVGEIFSKAKDKTIPNLTIEIKGSLSPQYMCGLEEIYRQRSGKAWCSGKDCGDKPSLEGVYKKGASAPPKAIANKDQVILFSFCDAFAQGNAGTDSVEWPAVLGSLNKRPEFALSRSFTDVDELREAHKLALVRLLLGDSLSKGELELSAVAAPGSPTNVVIRDRLSFSIAAEKGLILRERSSGTREVSGPIDQDSTLTLDFTGFGAMCGLLVSAPYTVVLSTTDDKQNAVAIKPPLIGSTCNPIINFKWSDYLGKSLTVELQYQMPGSGGRVVVAQSNKFTVRQLGLITSFPVVSEVVSAFKSSSPSEVNSTSSIPISWAIRTKPGDSSGRFTAITFPWKISYNFRGYPEFAKSFAFYPHVSVIVPVEKDAKTTFALGVGVSLAVFNFAYGIAPSDNSRYVLLGISVQDIVKVFK